jgi:DNA mismatch endonuclease (patch repair protein)
MDILTKQQRREVMSRIRAKDTAPERKVRSVLHGLGYRFRLHVCDLPGKPDIVLPKYKTVVLVHGCFWHRHAQCSFATTPKTRAAFWRLKFLANVARDRRNESSLRRMGWRVLLVWECEITDVPQLTHRLQRFLVAAKKRQGRPYCTH